MTVCRWSSRAATRHDAVWLYFTSVVPRSSSIDLESSGVLRISDSRIAALNRRLDFWLPEEAEPYEYTDQYESYYAADSAADDGACVGGRL